MICLGRQQPVGKALQPLLFGGTGTRPALWPVGTVEILHRDLGLCLLDLCPKLRRQLSLRLDGLDHLALFLFQVPQIGKPLVQCPKLLVIQRSCGLFSVSCDKRDGISLIDQQNSCLYLPQLHLQLPGDQLRNLLVCLFAQSLFPVLVNCALILLRRLFFQFLFHFDIPSGFCILLPLTVFLTIVFCVLPLSVFLTIVFCVLSLSAFLAVFLTGLFNIERKTIHLFCTVCQCAIMASSFLFTPS